MIRAGTDVDGQSERREALHVCDGATACFSQLASTQAGFSPLFESAAGRRVVSYTGPSNEKLGTRFLGVITLALFLSRGTMLVSKVRVVPKGGKVSEHGQLWWTSSSTSVRAVDIASSLKQLMSSNTIAEMSAIGSTLKVLERQHLAALRNARQRAEKKAEYQELALVKNAAVRF